MKNIVILILALSIFGSVFSQNATGYTISVTVPGWADSTCYLAYHYGDKQYFADTAIFNAESTATFEKSEALPGGIYLILLPDYSRFEFIVDKDQHFSLINSGLPYLQHMKVEGSEENQQFVDYMSTLIDLRARATATANAANVTSGDTSALNAAARQASNDLNNHIDQFTRAHYQTSLFGRYLKLSENPTVPPHDGSDKMFAYNYFKKHFFDYMDWSDDRLVNTPAYHQKLEGYVRRLTTQTADSILTSAYYILDQPNLAPELFRYTLSWLINEHANSKTMGFDKVYVELVKKYYKGGKAFWVDDVQLQKMIRDAANTEPLLMGKTMPNLVDLQRYNGATVSLYDINAPLTMMVFWDSNCSRCRKITPEFLKIYHAYKPHGLEAIGISVQLTEADWRNYIKQKGYDWINVIDPSHTHPFRDIFVNDGVPTVYVIDANHTIVAKKLDPRTLSKWMDAQLGVQVSKTLW